MGSVSDETRQMRLDRAVSLMAGDFQSHGIHGIAEMELLKRIESPDSGGVISGRTALMAEKALAKYVHRLKQENYELERRIESRKDVNEKAAGEQIRENEKEIKMIEGNCLNSLGGINNTILSPDLK